MYLFGVKTNGKSFISTFRTDGAMRDRGLQRINDQRSVPWHPKNYGFAARFRQKSVCSAVACET